MKTEDPNRPNRQLPRVCTAPGRPCHYRDCGAREREQPPALRLRPKGTQQPQHLATAVNFSAQCLHMPENARLSPLALRGAHRLITQRPDKRHCHRCDKNRQLPHTPFTHRRYAPRRNAFRSNRREKQAFPPGGVCLGWRLVDGWRTRRQPDEKHRVPRQPPLSGRGLFLTRRARLCANLQRGVHKGRTRNHPRCR
jgi:hypothetical protein